MSLFGWQIGHPYTVALPTDSKEVILYRAVDNAAHAVQDVAGYFVGLALGAAFFKGLGTVVDHVQQREEIANKTRAELDYDRMAKSGSLWSAYGTTGVAISMVAAYFVRKYSA